MPPKVSNVAQICRTCHVNEGQLFDGSKHKVAFEEKGWPECETCHGKHRIKRPTKQWVGDTEGTLCHNCHKKHAADNPECDKAAASFRKTFDDLDESRVRFEHEAEKLAERGMDVEPLEIVLSDLGDAIKQTRAELHSFEPTIFGKTAAKGLETVKQGEEFLEASYAEFSFRRKGLGAALGVLAFLAAVLWLKIREIDR